MVRAWMLVEMDVLTDRHGHSHGFARKWTSWLKDAVVNECTRKIV